MRNILYTIIITVLLGSVFSCTEDSLEPTLAQTKDAATSINSVEDLRVVLFGAYNRMTASTYYGRDFIIYGEVRSDNCYANGNSGRFITPASMAMGNTDAYATDTWTQIYTVIASANLVIGSENVTITGDTDQKNHIIGQAYAIRALAQFDLLKLYGQQHVIGGDNTLGVPYIMEFKGEDILPARNSVSQVKSLLEADVAKALSLMNSTLNDDSKEFFTTYAVQALKARIALYFGDWATVKTACEAVMNSGEYDIMSASDYPDSWATKGAYNSIFELAYRSTDQLGNTGLGFIYRGSAYGDIRVLDNLYNLFGPTDVRGTAGGMIGRAQNFNTNLGKYLSATGSDNIPLFRFEEVILNYAEALFELNQSGIDGDALYYLNLIPLNRDAPTYTSVTKDDILLERRKELCFEGFRFDDLARTGNDIPVLNDLNVRHDSPPYGTFNYAFPIPKVELNANSHMVQNFGYSSN